MTVAAALVLTVSCTNFLKEEPKTFEQPGNYYSNEEQVRMGANGAYYGIRKKDMTDALREHPINLAILDGNGVKQMRRLLRDNMVSIYLMTDYVCLIEHLLQIGYTNVEIKDLLQYYEKNHVFNGWKDADFVVKTTRGMQIALKQVLSIMGLTEMLPPEKLKNLIR